ncbi:MAG: SPFH domain-containing protein [Halobacteriaceae archaeon]
MSSHLDAFDEGRDRLPLWVGVLVLGGLALVTVVLADVIGPTTAVGLLFLVLAITTVASSVEVVQAYERRVVTFFGRFREVLGPGLSFIPPFVSQTYIFDMRTETLDVPQQRAITRDNSPVTADAVVYIRVMDAKKAFLEVDNYHTAVSNLAQTTLRAVLGDMELDETLSKRQEINRRIHAELDEPTDEWGVRVESVEVREVLPTPTVRDAMEEQSSAERRRRATIIEAAGERRAAIERAQGDQLAAITRAQGEKQAQILEAQGDAISTVLKARAADAMGERAVIDKSLETLAEMGTGPATTYVLPGELTGLLGRYGRHLSGGVQPSAGPFLDTREFDDRTATWLGLDDIDGLLSEIDIEDDGEGGTEISIDEAGETTDS